MKAEIIRSVVGLGGVALVVVGVWGLWGWAWAAIAAGLPIGGLYMYVEAATLTQRRPD